MIRLSEITDMDMFLCAIENPESDEASPVELAAELHASPVHVNPSHIVSLWDAGDSTEIELVTGRRIHVAEGAREVVKSVLGGDL